MPSTDTLDEIWPDEDDPVMRRLRAARPETPAALLDPGDLADRIVAARARRHRVPRWAAVAAAAIVAVALAVAPLGSPQARAADALVRDAAVASDEALGSGRAVMTGDVPFGSEMTYTFAGDDLAVDFVGTAAGAPFTAGRRVVDGEMYFFWSPGGTGEPDWLHDVTPGTVSGSTFVSDPRGLLAVLAPDAGFELVGDDTVDGVDVTRLHARTPEAVAAADLKLGDATMPDATVTALDVWIDRDDVVRRIDLTMTANRRETELDLDTGTSRLLPAMVSRISLRFTDIGVPQTVEAPASSRDVDMRFPPPA
jgi:hypothetical protein